MNINLYLLIPSLIIAGLASKVMFLSAYRGYIESEEDRNRSDDYMPDPKVPGLEKMGDAEYSLRFLAFLPPILVFVSITVALYLLLFLILSAIDAKI